jgi:pyridoxamine 5'-phosphate oxidase
MTLATVDDAGQPWTRTVLLKAFDQRGFVFYTNYTSDKARQIDARPQVSVLFPWLPLQRQVQITGRAEKVPTRESLKYFLSRPRGSQLGAWVSAQSSVISSRQVLETKLAELKRKFGEGKVPLPDFWGGYRIVADTVEFWQGRPNRLHDRFRYRRLSGGWTVNRLSP